MQKLGVVNEYLVAVDTAADGSGDGPNLVRESTEEIERRSEYRSSESNRPDDDDDDLAMRGRRAPLFRPFFPRGNPFLPFF